MAQITLDDVVIDQVKELAAQAYGHDSTSAGRGRIGMIGGHVVKFNTHRNERWSKSGSMTDMRVKALRSLAEGLMNSQKVPGPAKALRQCRHVPQGKFPGPAGICRIRAG